MNIKRFTQILTIAISLLMSASLQGQDASIQTDLDLIGNKLKWTSSFAFDLNQTLEDENENISSTLSSSLRVQNQNNNTYGVIYLYYDRDLRYTDTSTGLVGDIRDPLIELGGPLKLLPEKLLESQKVALVSTVAASKYSLDQDKVSSLALKYSYKLPTRTISINQYHRLTRSFYTKEITKGGSINNPWTYRLATQASYKLTRDWEFLAALLYDLNRSFQSVLKDGVTTDYKIIFYPNDSIDVYAGLASVGISTKEADGTTSRLKFVDEVRPTAYMGMSASF